MLLMNFYSLFCQVSFLTHYIFLKSRDVCFSVLNLVLPLFLMNAIHYYDLWVWYSNLCPSPRFLRKFVWLHQIFVAACGVWFPALGWNPGCLQSLFLFLLLSLEPDTQLLCACLCLHTSQESRPRLSRFNIRFDCSSTSFFSFSRVTSLLPYSGLWKVLKLRNQLGILEFSLSSTPNRTAHPANFIHFSRFPPCAAYPFALNQYCFILTQRFQEFFDSLPFHSLTFP